MKKIRYNIFALFIIGMILAALIMLLVSIVKHPGDVGAAIESWKNSLKSNTADGLQPATAALALDAVMVAMFIPVSLGDRPYKKKRSTRKFTASTQIMIDKTISYTLFFGCVTSWLLTEISPLKSDPRSLNTLIPIASALLCASLSRLADESAESHKLAQTEKSVREKNLRAARSAYRTAASNLLNIPKKHLNNIPWIKAFPFKTIVFCDALPVLLTPLLIYVHIGLMGRTWDVAMIAVALTFLNVFSQVLLVNSSAINQVLDLSRGKSENTRLDPPLFLLMLHSTMSSLAMAAVSITLSISLILLSIANVAIYFTIKKDPKYLLCVLRKIEERVAPSRLLKLKSYIRKGSKPEAS